MKIINKKSAIEGTTLLELLVAVGIISILAAIAVPNLQSAIIRSNTARAQSDMEAMAKAVTLYSLDNSVPPAAPVYAGSRAYDFRDRLKSLTSPVSYLNSIPQDPFPHRSRFEFDTSIDMRETILGADVYGYFRSDFSGPSGTYNFGKSRWMLSSSGPDGYIQYLAYYPRSKTEADLLCSICSVDVPIILLETILYQPSNGLISDGELIHWSE